MSETKPKPKNKAGCIALIVACIFIFVVFKCACESTPEDDAAYKEHERELTARVLARQFVEEIKFAVKRRI